MYCDECGEFIEEVVKFCPNCGKCLQAPSASSEVNIHDSVIQKKYDNRTYNIGSNINANSLNVYLTEENTNSVDVAEFLQKGILFYKQRNYKSSVKIFTDILDQDPSHAVASLYLGFSLMGGRNPLAIPLKIIRSIENHFVVALDGDDTRNGALLGLASIKYDNYLASGIIDKYPTYQEVKTELVNRNNLSSRDRDIMNYINASDDLKKDIFEYLS